MIIGAISAVCAFFCVMVVLALGCLCYNAEFGKKQAPIPADVTTASQVPQYTPTGQPPSYVPTAQGPPPQAYYGQPAYYAQGPNGGQWPKY